MKIQCNGCGAAEASVLCCADEAALCWACDQKVHAANMLAGKHQRVPLSKSSSPMPKCDICQETVGYFFCLEDRALLCRKCDVAIHTKNSLVSVHQRFLITGVKVGLETTESHTSPPSVNTLNTEKIPESESLSLVNKITPDSSTTQYGKGVANQSSGCGDFSFSKLSFDGSSTSQLQLDEFIGYSDFTQNYNFMDNGSSKVEGDDSLGKVPETYFAVPHIASTPEASGLYWHKNLHNPLESTVFVPDISSHHQNHSQATGLKRRRNL